MRMLEKGDEMIDLKKSVGKLTRQERARLRGGDKSVLFQRLGIMEDTDI